jgi:hypothetical protein
MKSAYSYSVLRYFHDRVTQEFINIGVAVYSADAKFFDALCTSSYGRISHAFERIDGNRFRELSRYIQHQIARMGSASQVSLPFDAGLGMEQLLARVLPPDDSALQFSKPGVGLSSDLNQTLIDLFQRYVERYALPTDGPRRTDEEIWRVFREPLDRMQITSSLRPKRIVAASYEYEFERSWKNDIWHVYEPVSFDMVEAGSILEKANRWVGRATSLLDSADEFRIHMLLGEPQDERLKIPFIKAQNILNKMPGKKEFVREAEANAFAEELAREMQHHPFRRTVQR